MLSRGQYRMRGHLLEDNFQQFPNNRRKTDGHGTLLGSCVGEFRNRGNKSAAPDTRVCEFLRKRSNLRERPGAMFGLNTCKTMGIAHKSRIVL